MASIGDEDDDMEDIGGEEEDDVDGMDISDKNLLISLLMNQQLSAGIPITNRIFNKYKTFNFDISCVELQGYRDAMEDKHLIYFNLNNNANISIFGVFDGHGGDLTSKFIKKELINILEENIINNQFDDKSLINCCKLLDQKWIQFELKRKKLADIKIAKKQLKLHKQIIQFTEDSDDNNNNNIDDDTDSETETETDTTDTHPMMSTSTNEFGCVGSTLVFSIIEYNSKQNDYKITTINLGDSRAILLKEIEEKKDDNTGYKLIELTSDHKPDLEEEKARIISAGGNVKYNRVDGDLALSRAIGDTKYKQNILLSMEEQKISCIPSITRYENIKSNDILMIYCDGIVEYKDNNDVFNFICKELNTMKINAGKRDINLQGELIDISISNHLRDSEINYLKQCENLKLIPKHNIELINLDKILLNLTDWALESGSKDNMSAMIIKFGKTAQQTTENINENNILYQRIWCPCEFYQHKIQFNNIGDEIKDKDKITLDRFMRLFEADCSVTGWDMSIKYQNALLQKILYINDLITNYKQKYDIKKLIQMQNNKLLKLESNQNTKKRKTMDNDDNNDNNNNNNGNDNDNDSPRKKRKLDE